MTEENNALEPTRRGYSDEEIGAIYELSRLLLESGNLRNAEPILIGLTEVAPLFAPAWLGLAYIHIQNNNLESAIYSARQALRNDQSSVEAMLFLISVLLSSGDINTAGSLLGEVQDKIEGGSVPNTDVVRFYKAQLARYQTRGQ